MEIAWPGLIVEAKNYSRVRRGEEAAHRYVNHKFLMATIILAWECRRVGFMSRVAAYMYVPEAWLTGSRFSKAKVSAAQVIVF